jgi:hypothetical protein
MECALERLRDRRSGLLVVVLVALVAAVAYAAQIGLWWARCQPLAPRDMAWQLATVVGSALFVLGCGLALPLALMLPRRMGLALGVAIVAILGLSALPGLVRVLSGNFVCYGDLVGG